MGIFFLKVHIFLIPNFVYSLSSLKLNLFLAFFLKKKEQLLDLLINFVFLMSELFKYENIFVLLRMQV